MNEQDKKAFEKWFHSNRDSSFAVFLRENYPDIGIKWDRESCSKAWQAACEYKQKEIDEFQWELNYRSERIKKLRDENAKLIECVEWYSNFKNYSNLPEYITAVFSDIYRTAVFSDMEEINEFTKYGGKRARQVLKELNKGESK